MNAKQTVIILVVLVLCVGGVFWVKSRREGAVVDPSSRLGEKVFPQLAVNEVRAFSIRSADQNVTVQTEEGSWVVADRGGYPADFDRVNRFLRELWGLKIADAQPVGESKLGQVDLLVPDQPAEDQPEDAADDPAGEADDPGAPGAGDEDGDGFGTFVQLQGGEGGTIGELVLGESVEGGASDSPFGFASSTARYVRRPDVQREAWIASEPLTDASPDPAQWLDKDFFRVQKVKTISFTAKSPEESWTLTRESETGDLQFADPKSDEELDSTKASPFKNAFSSPSFTDVAVDPDPAETGLDSPRKFHIETFEGFTYDISVGNQTEDQNYYLTVAVEGNYPREMPAEEKAAAPAEDAPPEDDSAPAEEDAGEADAEDAGEAAAEGDGDAAGEGEAEAAAGEAEPEEEPASAAPDADAEADAEAEPAAEPAAGDAETEEEKAERERKETEFAAELERKDEKLAQEERLEGHVYIVNRWSVDSLLKKRSELLKQPEAEAGEAGAATNTPQPRPRATAVTPPIRVPPLPEDGDAASEEVPADEPGEAEEPAEPDPSDQADDPGAPAAEEETPPADEDPAAVEEEA